MEILFRQEVTNIDGQQIRITIFKRDARSPKEIQNNGSVRYEHVVGREVFDNGVWHSVPINTIPKNEEILEYLTFDRQE